MPEVLVAEDVAPLFDQVKDEPDNMEKDLEAMVPSTTTSALVNPKGNFLRQRSTYYWISCISQLLQVSSQGGGLAVAATDKQFGGKGYTGAFFLTSGIYSSITFMITVSLLLVHYKSRETGPKRFMAGKHVGAARFCAILNFANLISVVSAILSHHSESSTDEIRPIVVPLLAGFLVVSVLADCTAAYITYKAAKRARGTELVADPEYRVAAWTLSTTEESQGLWRQGTIQLPL